MQTSDGVAESKKKKEREKKRVDLKYNSPLVEKRTFAYK